MMTQKTKIMKNYAEDFENDDARHIAGDIARDFKESVFNEEDSVRIRITKI